MEDKKETKTESLKKKTLWGTLWSAVERFSAQGISFIVMIIMARVLTPSDYGLVGMVVIFINVAQSLVDSGFSQALIRKTDRQEIDLSSAFYFNIAIGVLIYVVMWFIGPILANFYEEPKLTWITRFVCLGILFNSLVVVQRALFAINLDFKSQMIASICASVVAGASGIVMAYTGLGVWSIVFFQLLNSGLNCILLWVFSKWRPKRMYSWASFRSLFSFGFKLSIAGLLTTLYNSAYNMVIGKVFKASDLGYYTRANQFSFFFSTNITNIVQRVSFPVLCKYQEEPEQLRKYFNNLLYYVSFLMFSIMMFMAGVSRPLILFLLGEEWLFSSELLQILCFAMMWNWVYALNLSVLLIVGRSDLFLKLEIIKKVLFIIVLIITVRFGLVAMCWGQVANALMEVIINSYYTGRFIGMGILRQLRSLLPVILVTVSMGFLVWLTTKLLNTHAIIQLGCALVVGVIYLAIFCLATKNKVFQYASNILKRLAV